MEQPRALIRNPLVLLWKRLEIRRGTAVGDAALTIVALWKRLEIRRGTAGLEAHLRESELWKRLEIRRGTAVVHLEHDVIVAVETS